MKMMKSLKSSVVQGIARHLLGAIGGVVTGAGLLDGETVQAIIGLIMTGLSIYFSASAPEKRKPVPVALPLEPSLQHLDVLPDDAPLAPLPGVINDKAPVQAIAPPKNKFYLSERSLKNMEGVDPLLVRVVKTAIDLTTMDFGVTEGLRTESRQRELIAQKKSFVTRSKHQDGLAIDVIAYPTPDGSWEPKDYYPINDAFQEAAIRCGARITWGGTWKMGDYVHFQLDGNIA